MEFSNSTWYICKVNLWTNKETAQNSKHAANCLIKIDIREETKTPKSMF